MTRVIMTRVIKFMSLLMLCKNAFAQESIDVLVYHAPPYIIESEGKLEGVTIEIIKAAFREAKLVPDFKPYPFARSIVVCAERPDCVWVASLEVLDGQIQGELFQVAFLKFTTHFFYNHKMHPDYQNTKYSDDFSGKSIGLLASEFGNLEVFTKQGAVTHKLNSHNALFRMLINDRIDYAHFVSLIGYIEMSNYPEYDIRPLKETLRSSDGGFIFKDQRLAKQIQQALIRLKKNGELARIIEQELGSQIKINANDMIPDTISLTSKVFD